MDLMTLREALGTTDPGYRADMIWVAQHVGEHLQDELCTDVDHIVSVPHDHPLFANLANLTQKSRKGSRRIHGGVQYTEYTDPRGFSFVHAEEMGTFEAIWIPRSRVEGR